MRGPVGNRSLEDSKKIGLEMMKKVRSAENERDLSVKNTESDEMCVRVP